MNPYESQTQAILRMLKERDITAIDALREAGCLRLAARISDLRAEGHEISSQMVTTASGKRVARYSLGGQPRLW
jgi:predicted transcriptional regulator